MTVLRLVAVALILAFPAAAEEARPLSEAEHAAWTAVGRINVGGLVQRGGCTGALVAPDLVLTAAHCIPPRALRPEAPEPVHFLAGWYLDTYAAHRTARAVHLHPDFERGTRGLDRLASDVALLVLETPVPAAAARPLRLGPMPRFVDAAEIVGYSNRRPGALSRAGPCAGVEVAADTLGLGCPVISGNSGAPLLVRDEDGWAMVAVTVATGGRGARVQSYAVRAAAVLFRLAGRPAP